MLSDHIIQDVCLGFQTGGWLLLRESSTESRSFLRYLQFSNKQLSANSDFHVTGIDGRLKQVYYSNTGLVEIVDKSLIYFQALISTSLFLTIVLTDGDGMYLFQNYCGLRSTCLAAYLGIMRITYLGSNVGCTRFV